MIRLKRVIYKDAYPSRNNSVNRINKKYSFKGCYAAVIYLSSHSVQNLASVGQKFGDRKIKIKVVSDATITKTSYCSYARPAQPGPNRTRLCGPYIAAICGD